MPYLKKTDVGSATIEIFARLQLLIKQYFFFIRSATIEIFARLQRFTKHV